MNSIINSCIKCGEALKWIPVLFIVSVLAWSYYAYVIQLCFFFIQNTVQLVFYFVIFHVILFMLAWSYWQTVFVPVGTVPKQFRLSSADMERLDQATTQEAHKQIFEELASNLPVLTRNPQSVRYCEKCVHIKPDRSHHCSICGVCVTKMDHHCPWVNNCVGFANYKFFILFLGYAFTFCVFIALSTLPFFMQFWRNELSGNGKFHILFLFFVSTMFSVSVVSLWGYHIYLVLHNRSTLEAYRAPIFRSGPDKDGFNLGKYNNFIEVFGDRKALWFIPVFTSLGDGVSFPSRQPAEPVASSPVNCQNSVDPCPPPPPPPPNPNPSPTTIVSVDTPQPIANMGDGIIFPQRHMDEDEDSLLGARQRWMEEGGPLEADNSGDVTSPYHTVNLDPLVQTV